MIGSPRLPGLTLADADRLAVAALNVTGKDIALRPARSSTATGTSSTGTTSRRRAAHAREDEQAVQVAVERWWAQRPR